MATTLTTAMMLMFEVRLTLSKAWNRKGSAAKRSSTRSNAIEQERVNPSAGLNLAKVQNV